VGATRTPTDPPDPEEVARFAFRVWGYKQGEMVWVSSPFGGEVAV